MSDDWFTLQYVNIEKNMGKTQHFWIITERETRMDCQPLLGPLYFFPFFVETISAAMLPRRDGEGGTPRLRKSRATYICVPSFLGVKPKQ
jgi:hypothetical protein